jgi:hypothetical protein
MWGAHCGVLWPQPSSTSQGCQAHRAPRQTPGSFAADRMWQYGIGLTAEVSCGCETTMAASSTHRRSISYGATRTEWDKKRNCIMKATVIVTFLLSIVTASEPAFTTVRSKLPNDEPPHLATVGVSTDNAHVLADPNPSSTGEVVLVAMPFSSLQLSPSLVEYLGLSRTQAKAIQKLMDHERPTTEPLMDELRTVSAGLGVAIRQNQSNESEGVAQSLAATQARLLKQLMRVNSRLQRKIDEVLGRQQRKKLDALRHRAEVSVVHGS